MHEHKELVNEKFRFWITVNPFENFPISIL